MLVRFDTHDRGVSHRSQSNAENVMDVGIKNLKSGARVDGDRWQFHALHWDEPGSMDSGGG